MSPDKAKRPTRREQADASRRKVLNAAHEAFMELGYHGATMGDIASRSGLAVQTVAYYFGTKPRLLSELINALVTDTMGESRPLDSEAWHRAMNDAPSGAALIDAFVGEGFRILASLAAVTEVLRIGAKTDEDVQDLYRQYAGWRRRDYSYVIDSIERIGDLREDGPKDKLVSMALTLFGPQTYLALSQEHDWADEDIQDCMADALKLMLLRQQ